MDENTTRVDPEVGAYTDAAETMSERTNNTREALAEMDGEIEVGGQPMEWPDNSTFAPIKVTVEVYNRETGEMDATVYCMEGMILFVTDEVDYERGQAATNMRYLGPFDALKVAEHISKLPAANMILARMLEIRKEAYTTVLETL